MAKPQPKTLETTKNAKNTKVKNFYKSDLMFFLVNFVVKNKKIFAKKARFYNLVLKMTAKQSP